jgi:anti-anti-sigma factor
MADQFGVSVESSDGVVTLALAGDLDLAGVPALRDAVAAAVSGAVHQIVLDCTLLSFIDSSGLGCLVEIRNRASEQGGTLILANVPVAAARTITIAGLADVLGIDPVG